MSDPRPLLRTLLARALWHMPPLLLILSITSTAVTGYMLASTLVAYERQLAEQARV